jgi:tetratricopeptide (TPR) repeat protein
VPAKLLGRFALVSRAGLGGDEVTVNAVREPERSVSEFAVMFSELVAEATRRLGKLKKQLAKDCELRPDRLSHLQAGSRRPTHVEVLKIGRGLRLDEATLDRLLKAAGFSPMATAPGLATDAGVVAERLGSSERQMALAEMERDLTLVRDAWEHYAGSQTRNQARDWADASRRHQEGVELYWQLRAMAARFLSQVDLVAAAADPHLNRMAEAEARCEEGLEAAVVAGNRPFQVMLLARLASIKRLSSDYQAAGELYDQALEVLDGLPATAHEEWRAYWQARIQRMQGMLELFQGHPMRALEKLEPSLAHFQSGEHWEELSQVCYGLGWAHGLRGDQDDAASWDRQGLEHAEMWNRTSGHQDMRPLLQGHLYLGGDYLDLDDLVRARHHLEQATTILSQHPQLAEYHEVGRVPLLQGRLAVREGDLELAHRHLREALRFFSGRQEQMLLATAHNAMGDLHLAQGGAHLQRALDHYLKALLAARASRPPNTYYECAALINICRARIRAGLPAAELATRRDAPPGTEDAWDMQTLIDQARLIGRTHRYLNHRARLAVLEAEWAHQHDDEPTARRAARSALHLANNFGSPHLLAEVGDQLATLGLPHRLTDIVRPDDEPA